MKKVLFFLTVLFVIGCTAYAENCEIIKMSMNGAVKNTGGRITFTLPDPATAEFILSAVELQIFERREGGVQWESYRDESGAQSKRRLVQSPSTLKYEVSFENPEDFREKAKYKIGYRFYMQSAADPSKIVVAGEDIKSGWRLVGETDGTVATDTGLMFYRNSPPTISINEVFFDVQTISGMQTLYYTPEELANIWLPSDVFQNGITVNYDADDFDSEDMPSISYRMENTADNSVIQESALDISGKIISSTDADNVRLILRVTDHWGASSEAEGIELRIDKEAPRVIDEFDDKGRVLKGRNLYSRFTVNDGPNEALSAGNIYYTIRHEGTTIYQNVKFPNHSEGQYTINLTGMPDGQYEMELTIFDKAHNKMLHVLTQTLDNTGPEVSFLTPDQHADATLYSTWMNESKKMLFTASDSVAGVKFCLAYLDNAWHKSISLTSPKEAHTFSIDVSAVKTGNLFYAFYVYDNACSVDQSGNMANTSVSGNATIVTRYVWLDKTPPDVAIHTDTSQWYNAPLTVYAEFNDNPSSVSAADNSGVREKYYCITQDAEPGDNWRIYTDGVLFDTGGVFYLHCKAIDYAGNEMIESKKIMINAQAQLVSNITPVNDSRHTIYHQLNRLYIIKNTAYTTKYHFTAEDTDIHDTLRTDIALVSQDNPAVYSTVTVDTLPNGSVQREVTFNLLYTLSDGTPLPDGIYTMYVSVSEIKNDDTVLPAVQNVPDCEVMLKRISPPDPVIQVADGKVSIEYPEEPLAASLNRFDIKELYKRQYKAVYENGAVYLPYEAYVSPIDTGDMTVTALYTDPAGNIAAASKRILIENDPSGANNILKDGNTVHVDESRPANIYYIGTRREKQKGINESIFNFLEETL